MSDFIELCNRGIFDDEGVREQIRAQLAQGRAVVIPDALRADVAERAHRELDETTRWKPYEGDSPFFHYRHHNLYSDQELPESALALKASLSGRATTELMTTLSGQDCSGPVQFGASLYLPGDHSLPHQDLGLGRSVAWVWHLTKDWDPRWGGGFFWCPSGVSMAPQFNCFTLFTVTPASAHFVTVVSGHARSKRLALNGWWTCVDSEAIGRVPDPPGERGFDAAGYGPPLEYLDSAAKIIVI